MANSKLFIEADMEFTNSINAYMSNEEYHAHPAISRSGLIDFEKSPYNYWAKHINPNKPKIEPTPAMLLGSAFHHLILQPETFDDFYAVAPKQVFLKDVGREVYDAYKAILKANQEGHKTLLTNQVWETLKEMQSVFHNNKTAMELIDGAKVENSIFWQDPHTGLQLKCRPDAFHHNVIIDLKTIYDASPRVFQTEMVRGGYHIQGAMIKDGLYEVENLKINTVINIVIENKYPYTMGIYLIDEFAIDEGAVRYKNLCRSLKVAIEDDNWQDLGVQTVSLPGWYKS